VQCNVSGVVTYGSFVQLRSRKRSDHLLFSDSRSRAPGSTAQAVLSWREPRDPDGSSETNGNWWQVLGPAGTSADFLLNSPVLGGAVIRLQHVSSGAFLRGDGSQPAFTRKDLREVSAAAAAVSPSDVDRSSIEWQLTVNGTSVERLEWGLAWAIALRHVATQDLLTCSGQTYPVSQPEVFGKKHYMVHEVQLQRYIAGSLPFPKDPGFVTPAQVWSLARHRAPATSPAHTVPFSRHSIIRLASPTSMCYLNYRVQPQEPATLDSPSTGLGCEATDDMSELWVVVAQAEPSAPQNRRTASATNTSATQCDGLLLSIDNGLSRDDLWEELNEKKLWQLFEKTDAIGLGEESVEGLSRMEVVDLLLDKIFERRNLETACRRASAELVPSGPRLQRGSRVKLVHLLTRRTIYWVQNATRGRAQVVALPDASNMSLGERSDCLRIDDAANAGGGTEWVVGEAISLQICGTNATIQSIGQHIGWQAVGPGTTGSDETAWVGERVRQLPANASKLEMASKLARVCEESGAYHAAEDHLTSAITEGKSLHVTHRELANLHFGRARIFMRLGRPSSAIRDLVAAREYLPEFAEAALYYGRIATTLGRWDEAHEAFSAVTSNISDDQPLHYRASLYLHQINNITGSMSKASEALQVSMDAYSSAGRCHMSDGDRDVLQWARRLMTDALQAAPESTAIRIQRAETNLLLGDLGAAKSDATWVIRLSRSSPEGYFLRGRAHLHMFDHDAAKSYFKWCVKVDVEHVGCANALRSLKAVGVHTKNASSSFRFGNFSAAAKAYQESIDAMPDHCFHVALMRLQRCRCFIYLNDPDAAVSECQRAGALDPELRDAETLERDAKTIANSYQDWVAEELKKKQQKERKEKAEEEKRKREAEEKAREAEKERLRKEAEEKGEEFVDPEDPAEYANRTRIETRRTRQEWETDRIVKSMALCEQHFYRLNMSSLKMRKVRCVQPKLLRNHTLCQKLRGCDWEETVDDTNADVVQDDTVNSTMESTNGTVNDTESSGTSALKPGVCVPKPPTTNDVKRSYRRMAMAWHPDKKHKPRAKERAEKVFQTIVESYEFLGDDKQLSLCNAGDVKKAEQHHQQQQKKQEKKQQQQQKQQEKPNEPPKNKPQPGRSKAEPPKQDAPTWSRMDWHVKPSLFGLLPKPPHVDVDASTRHRHRFSFSVLISRTDQEQASTVTRLSLTGLESYGHPETLIHWQSARPASVKGNLEDLRKKFGVKDEYGKHTAGNGANGWGDSGAQAEKSWFIPTSGRLQLFFNADDSANSKGKDTVPDLPIEMRVFNIDIRDYDFAELLAMPNEQSGVSFLRLDIDNRQGPVDVFVGLSRITTVSEGQTKLRLDSLTAVFSDDYWQMKESLTRKMGLLTEGGMDAAESSSIHYAVDGDNSTTFETAGALEQDQALVVDLQVIYNLRKAVLIEEPGHECHACAIEVSVDRLWWWPLHTFTRGVGETAEWRQRHEDDLGVGPTEFPIVARYVRVVATADEWREHKPYWGVTEFEVFGDELGDSLIADAPVWLEGGDSMTALDEEIVGGDEDDEEGNDEEQEDDEPMRRGPLSYATDGDTSTSFVTALPPMGLLENDALVIDLLDIQMLALIVVWQNESLACTMCMIQKSLDGEEWDDIQLMVHTDGMVVAGFGPDANVVARYIRFAVIEPMPHAWEVIDIAVHGGLVLDADADADADTDTDIADESDEDRDEDGEERPA
jgi:tetratricopeptide (TPR) repeat protein